MKTGAVSVMIRPNGHVRSYGSMSQVVIFWKRRTISLFHAGPD